MDTMAVEAEAIHRPGATEAPAAENTALERALERLFRLSGNRRFDARQAATVGATVTRAGYALLRSLSDHGPLGLRELATASYMDAAGASRQVSQLVDAGLVDRRGAADDARAIELTLTDEGREVYERIVHYRLHHLADVLSSWSEDDRSALTGLVDRLATDLGGGDFDDNSG
jgi:DNA-binding MarR family transcriptional regulator